MALSSTFVCTVVLSTFWSITFSTFCPGVKRDLVILLDDSGSLTSDDFIQGKDFLEDFITQLDVGRYGYQVAVVKFSDRVRLIADLLKPKDDLIKRIRGIIHYGGATHTGKALDFSLRRVFKKNNRDDVPDQILVLTDGDSDDKDETLKQIEKAHAQNIQIIAVGIGDKVSGDKLRSLASGDDLVFMVNNFSVLDSIRDTLLVASCAETTTTTSSTTLLSTSTDTTATKTTVTTSMTPTLAGTILTAAVKSATPTTKTVTTTKTPSIRTTAVKSAPPTSKTVTVTKTKTPSNRTTAVKSIPSTTVTTTTEAPTTPVTETTADTPPPPLTTTTTTSAKTSNRQTATTETITTSTTITATPVEIPTQSTRITTANRPIATTKAALTTLTSTKSTGTALPKTLTRNDKRLWYVVGGTVAAFVLACIAVGLVVLIIKNYTSKKQQSVMEVL